MKPTRRQVAQGTAWSAPVIMIGSPAAAMAASAACGTPPMFSSVTPPSATQSPFLASHFSLLNVDTQCSFKVTQLTVQLKINTQPTDTSADAIWYGLSYDGQGQNGSSVATVAGGQTVTVTSNQTPVTVSPQNPEAKWTMWFDWGNVADHTVRMSTGANVSLTYTMSGVDQHGQAWGPVVLVLDNNGAGYDL